MFASKPPGTFVEVLMKTKAFCVVSTDFTKKLHQALHEDEDVIVNPLLKRIAFVLRVVFRLSSAVDFRRDFPNIVQI